MGYRIRKTEEYLASEASLRQHFIGIISPRAEITSELLDKIGVDTVLEGPFATPSTVYEFNQFAGLEKKEDGNWYTKYVIGPTFKDFTNEKGELITAAQQLKEYKDNKDLNQALSARVLRNELLNKSDWSQLLDSPLNTEKKALWSAYRQSLRDITTQEGFPWVVTWPEAPK